MMAERSRKIRGRSPIRRITGDSSEDENESGFDKMVNESGDTSSNSTQSFDKMVNESGYTSSNSTQSFEGTNWNGSIWVLGPFIAVIIILLGFLLSQKCERSVKALKSEFKEQTEELWQCVHLFMGEESGVSTLIILHSPDAESTASCLAQQIAETYACNQLNHRDNITTINPTDVNVPGDHGIVLERYRETVGAVVVKDANLIEAKKAQIFHTMTDTIEPFKKPALYIFTLQSTSTEKPERAARRILQNAWGQLDFNLLDPLLSRVIGHVVPISRETKLPCSPQ